MTLRRRPPRPLSSGVARALAAAALLVAAAAGAEEPCPCPPAEAPPVPRWKVKMALSYLATGGNAESETLGFGFEAARRPEPWGLELFARYDRVENAGAETSERSLGGARVLRALGERWELFGESSLERDRAAGFDRRWLVAAGGTLHALEGPTHLLDLDLGLTWTDEDRLAPAEDASAVGALAGLSYEWVISERAAFRERLSFYPNFEESRDWRLDSTTTLEAALTDRLAFALSYELRYAHEPIHGRDDTDTTTRVALVLSL